MGGDPRPTRIGLMIDNFNPLRPCGRRLIGYQLVMWVIRFQSTPPVWAETAPLSYKSYQAKISIHSARVGGDAYWQCFHNKNWTYFNPLRPCGRRPSLMLSTSTPFSHFNPLRPCGRRLISANFGDASDEFQSTPPVWAETSC